MEISIRDFRCFHNPAPVSARPINILVGENSAGKTSFLAAARFMFDLFDERSKASFNKDPFHLGAYENIAHYRGGRFGRAQSFGFEVQGVTRLDPRRRSLLGASEADRGPDVSFKLEARFIEKKSQPTLDFVSFSAGDYGIAATLTDSTKVEIRTPSSRDYVAPTDRLPLRDEGANLDLSFLEILIRNLSFLHMREGSSATGTQPLEEEFDTLYALYRNARRSLPNNVYASAPVRSRPERTYNPTDFTTAPDGAHIPFVLAQLKYFETSKWDEINKTLSAFGKSSGLFEEVSIKQVGQSAGSPFQIIVNMQRRKANLVDVGYGVSQALPIVTDVLRASRGSLFLFQQPEVHLHPKAQAELGSFFAQIVKQKHHTLFIETHSDHLIDRIRMHVRDGNDLKPSDVAILYFERDGHDVQIHQITIDKTGNLLGAPPNYRTFFLEEEMRSLGVR